MEKDGCSIAFSDEDKLTACKHLLTSIYSTMNFYQFILNCPYEILYADSLPISAEPITELGQKFLTWKSILENHGLRVNLHKFKIMHCKYHDNRVSKGTKELEK